MKLIVGLGNPGKEYDLTRHNMGFFYLDYYADKNNIQILKEKDHGKYETLTINQEKIILLKPQSYINLSGDVVHAFMNFYHIDVKDVLIICDDLDTPVGSVKIKSQGSSGGHNGLKNIEKNLGTSVYSRVKIGIANDKSIDTKDYVLSKLSKEDLDIMQSNAEKVCNIIDDFIAYGIDKTMSLHNTK